MLKIKFLILSVLIMTLVFMAGAEDNSIGSINFLIGDKNDVKIKNAGQAYWTNARLNTKVKSNNQIKTQLESRCEVKLNDGSTVRIDEKSNFKFSSFSNKSKRSGLSSFLSWGRIWANIKKAYQPSAEFKITAPSAVCAVRGTIYRMETDSTTRIMVYDGAVDVGPVISADKDSSRSIPPSKSLQPRVIPGPHEIPGPYEVTLDQWIRIVKGYQIEIRPDGKYAKSRINENIDNQSDWVRWNKERDSAIKR